MSEDEARRVGNAEEPQDEVEAHRRHAGANDEQPGEAEIAGDDDNDVEAHRRLTNRPGKTG
jgi:hypothetical protein